MRWSSQALKEMERVPFFIRKMVKKRVEEYAHQHGADEVVPRHLEACRQRFMKNQESEVKGYRLETCFGDEGCDNRVLGPSRLVEKLDGMLAGKGFREFLQKNIQGPLKMHHEFRVSVSFCPNACSRPQIVDIGIIGAVRPRAAQAECTMCMACLEECREEALNLEEGRLPLIDQTRCLFCGHCVRVCPAGVLETGAEGFRVMAGGKLGRHPRLGHELPGIFSEEETMEIAERIVSFYLSNSRQGERLGALTARIGLESLYRFINVPFEGQNLERQR